LKKYRLKTIQKIKKNILLTIPKILIEGSYIVAESCFYYGFDIYKNVNQSPINIEKIYNIITIFEKNVTNVFLDKTLFFF